MFVDPRKRWTRKTIVKKGRSLSRKPLAQTDLIRASMRAINKSIEEPVGQILRAACLIRSEIWRAKHSITHSGLLCLVTFWRTFSTSFCILEHKRTADRLSAKHLTHPQTLRVTLHDNQLAMSRATSAVVAPAVRWRRRLFCYSAQ